MKKLISMVLCMLLLEVILSGCAQKALSGNDGYMTKVIRINDSGSYGSAVISVMRTRNLLVPHLPEGVTVEWSAVEGGPNIRDAIASKQVDIGTFAGATFILAMEGGMPLTLVSNGSDGPTKLFSKDPEIKSLTDIPKTARISLTNKATNAHFSFMAACKDEVGDPNYFDSNLVPLSNADALVSIMSSDEFTCSLFTFPSDIKAEQIEGVNLVMDLTQIAQKYSIGSYLVANEEFYKNNPVLVEAINKAYAEAIDFMIENPSEAAKILGEAYGIEPENVQNLIETLPPRAGIAGYDNLAGLLYESGLLENEPKKFEDLPNYDSIPKAQN